MEILNAGQKESCRITSGLSSNSIWKFRKKNNPTLPNSWREIDEYSKFNKNKT